MADYVPAWIEIGGRLPTSLADTLIRLILVEALRDDFGGEPLVASDADELLSYAEGSDQAPATLKAYHETVHNGQFAELEPWLEEHNIGFDRHSDAGAEFSAELVRFRPGWPAPTVTLLDAIGREVILTEYILEALHLLRGGKTAAAIKHLAELANEGVAPLEPLAFVD
jgi:hypothetical protein